MEERKLRAHLITIYVVTIAGILAAMLAVVLLLSARELEQKNRESFQTLLTELGVNATVRRRLGTDISAATRKGGASWCWKRAGATTATRARRNSA